MVTAPIPQYSVTHRDPAPCFWHVMTISNWMTPLIKNRAPTAADVYEWLRPQFVYILRFACLLSPKPKPSVRIVYCGSDVDIFRWRTGYLYLYWKWGRSVQALTYIQSCWLYLVKLILAYLVTQFAPRKQNPSQEPGPLHKHRMFGGSEMAQSVFN